MGRRVNGGAIVRALDALGAISGNLGIPGGGVSYYYKRRSAFDTSFVEQVFAEADRKRERPLEVAVAAAALAAFRERRAARLAGNPGRPSRSPWWEYGLREGLRGGPPAP